MELLNNCTCLVRVPLLIPWLMWRIEACRAIMFGVLRTCGDGTAKPCASRAGEGAGAGLFIGVLFLGDMKILSMRRLKPRFYKGGEREARSHAVHCEPSRTMELESAMPSPRSCEAS